MNLKIVILAVLSLSLVSQETKPMGSFFSKVFALAPAVTVEGSEGVLSGDMPDMPKQLNGYRDVAVYTADSIKKGAEAINYIGRDVVIDSLNNVSNATNNLVTNGVALNIHLNSAIPQLALCSIGTVAALCSIGIVTHTLLQDQPKNPKTKYALATFLAASGLAAIIGSKWL